MDLQLQLDVPANAVRGGRNWSGQAFSRWTCSIRAHHCRKAMSLIWLSQFLDCFSEDRIVAILGKVCAALPPRGRLWILELFWDRQRFEAAAFSLQQTSLYFTCIANGNSQMYDSSLFFGLCRARRVSRSAQVTDGVGGYHTLLECAASAAWCSALDQARRTTCSDHSWRLGSGRRMPPATGTAALWDAATNGNTGLQRNDLAWCDVTCWVGVVHERR